MSPSPTTGTMTSDDAARLDFSVGAVSWPAIVAGGVAAVAVSLLLTLFGTALGLSFTSPWVNAGVSAVTFSMTAAIWLIIVQWAASAFGGYISGRLRARWTRLHTDEVFFRDTVHGFLAWAMASIFTVAFLTSALASVLGTGTQAAATVAAGGASNPAMARPAGPGADNGPFAYYIDGLYRNDKGTRLDMDARNETNRLFMNGIRNGEMPAADKEYLARNVEAHTGVSHEEAVKRVDDAEAGIVESEVKAKQAADAARKAAAAFSFFTFFSMLIGAFISSVAAAIGGRQRDEY